jgi:dUTP pyrophosphatase
MKFLKVNLNGTIPTRATTASAGYDLTSPLNYLIQVGERQLIPTGIGWTDIPHFIMGDIRPRSGLAYKKGIDVLAGVIDADYDMKDIGVILINHGDEPFQVKEGDKIAQLVLRQVITMGDVPEAERDGGFGSTGT